MANEVTTQIVREAEPIEQAKLQLMQAAANLRPTALPAYQVAGFSPEQIQAIRYGVQGIGAYQPYLAGAASRLGTGAGMAQEGANILLGADTRGQFEAARQAMAQAGQTANRMGQAQQTLLRGIGALRGAAQGFDPRTGAVKNFMNPFRQEVIDESIRQINRQGDISRQNLQAQAVRAGAFGSSREGIQRAELERALSEQRNAAITGTLFQGYNQAQQAAQQAFEQQKQRQLAQAQGYQGAAGQQANIYGSQAQLQQALGMGMGNLANQQFGIGQAMGMGLGSLGTQLGNLAMQNAALAQTGQQMGQQDVNFLFNLGAEQQKQQQAALDAYRATAMQTAYQPMQHLAFISDIYKGAPSSQMAMTSQMAPTPSPFQQFAGLGIGALSAAAAANRAGIL